MNEEVCLYFIFLFLYGCLARSRNAARQAHNKDLTPSSFYFPPYRGGGGHHTIHTHLSAREEETAEVREMREGGWKGKEGGTDQAS